METSSSINTSEKPPMKLSFAVKKKVETKITVEKAIILDVPDSDDEDEERASKRRNLSHLEDGFFPEDEEDIKKKKKDTMVIPLVLENDWRVAKLKLLEKEGTITDEDRAKLAILTEMQPFKAEEQTANGDSIVVDAENKETEDADYSAVPIESFGLAILRGCGWADGEGIGKNPQVVKLRVPNRRPKGLGLGAVPAKPDKPKNGEKLTKKEEEELSGEIAKGSLVKILQGINKGSYGKVESRDDDNNSLFIKLALGGKNVKINLFGVCKVTKKEYDRDSKCLNKDAYEREKEKIEMNKEDKYGKEKERDRKREHARHIDDDRYERRNEREELWARVDLVVRLIDEDYRKGKYMGEKMRVTDVADRRNLTLEDNSGKHHYNIRQSWIETVIPRNEGEKIMVVRGEGCGQPAIMERKDKKRQLVILRIIQTDEVLKVSFDDVCSFKPSKEYDSE